MNPRNKKLLVKIPFFTRLDALVQHRNQFLLKKVEYDINMRINEEAFNDAKERGELDENAAISLGNEVSGQKIGSEAFGRSLEIVDTMIQEEINNIKKDKEEKHES